MNTTSRVLIFIGLLCFGAVLLSHTARINSLTARCQKLEVAIKALNGYARDIHSVLDDVVEQQARADAASRGLVYFPPSSTNYDLQISEPVPRLEVNSTRDMFIVRLEATNGTVGMVFMDSTGLWFNAPTGFCLLTTNVVWLDGSVKER